MSTVEATTSEAESNETIRTGEPGHAPEPEIAAEDAIGEIGEHHTFCRFCIALCGVVVTTQGDQVLHVRGDPGHPVSRGYTCPKGRALGLMHHHPDRLDHPLVRRAGRLERVGWDECLDDLTARLREVLDESGPDAVGMYLATASAFDANGRRVAERFMRAVGSQSKYTSTTVDTPCKPLVSEMMAGHPGMVPALDWERATFVLLIGSNPVVSHGHLNAFPDPIVRLRQLVKQGEVWVIDPRRTETARLATRHLAPRPGTDHIVLAHVVRELLRDGADWQYLAEHAEGVERLQAAVEPFDLPTAARRSSLPEADLTDLVAAVRRHGRIAAQTGTGTTMSRSANVTEWLTWALHVVTASYDRLGGMWFHPGFLKQLDRREFDPGDAVPGEGPRSRPELPRRWGEYPCAAMADEIEAGNLRALFVVGGNPITSLPDVERLKAAFAKLDVLVVSDIAHTDTTALATHVLPCAGQLERPDIPHYIDQFQPVVASQYGAAVFAPAAERKPMWWPFAKVAEGLGLDVLAPDADPDVVTDDELLSVLADRSRASFAELQEAPTALVAETAVFGWVEERGLPGGRWRLAPEPLADQLAELPDPPTLVLTPRRQLRHLNSQLRELAEQGPRRDHPEVLVHPVDAEAAGIADGDEVRVESASGHLVGVARVDESIRPGAVSVPHGFSQPNVGALTSGSTDLDPLTGMVLQSGLAVSIRPTKAVRGTRTS